MGIERDERMNTRLTLTVVALAGGLVLSGCGVSGGDAPVVGVPVTSVQSSGLPPLAGAAPAGATPLPAVPSPSIPATNLPQSSQAGLPAGAPPSLLATPPAAGTVVASGAVAAPPSPVRATGIGPSTPQIVAGEWNSTDRNASASCRITLTAVAVQGIYRASPYGCTSQDLFRISGWVLRGDELTLVAAGGVSLVSFRPNGPNRFEGLGGSGERFVLWR